MRYPVVLALSVGLAACAAPQKAVAPVRPTLPARSTTLPTKGLEAVLGKGQRDLERMFGTPRLDIRETTVRKLQFANGRCVLDAYLYAPARGKEPVVTHVDARNPTGADVDPAACVSALQSK